MTSERYRLTAERASILLGILAVRNSARLFENPSPVARLVRERLDVAHTDAERRMAQDCALGWVGDDWSDDTALTITNRFLKRAGLPPVSRGHLVGLGVPYLRGKVTVPLYSVVEEDEFIAPRVAALQPLTVDGDPGTPTGSARVLPRASELVSIAGPGDMDPDGGIVVAPTPLDAIRWRCSLADAPPERVPTVVSVAGKAMNPEQARQIAVLARGGSIVVGSPSSPWDNRDPLAWDSEKRVQQFLRELKATSTNVELAQIPAPEDEA